MAFFERLSALDASFLHLEEDSTHMHVAIVLICDATPLQRDNGDLDFDSLRRWVEVGLDATPRYRQRLAELPLSQHPVWVDDPHFKIAYHVRHTSLPRPGTRTQLKELVARVMSQKLDRAKPLWELWVAEGLEGNRVGIVLKVHHCMIDGIGGVDLLTAMMGERPMDTVPNGQRWQPERNPSTLELMRHELERGLSQSAKLMRTGISAALNPMRTLASLRDAAGGIFEVMSAALQPASETPLNPLCIGPHRRFDWIRFELEDVKEVKRKLGGTINDIVLATASGALRRYLANCGAPVDELNFRAALPVNVRPTERRGRTGNFVSMLLAPLPIDVDSPKERLERVIETTQRLKTSRQSQGTELMEAMGEWTSASWLASIMQLSVPMRSYNVIVTNVPGPQVPLHFLGAPILESYPMVPLFANQALGIALFSYNGGLHWGLNADWDRVPDLHSLADSLATEFQELQKLAAQV